MVVIFSQALSDEKHNLLMDKISNYEDFSINKYNFSDFFDCNYVLDVLNDKKIDYQITLDDCWSTRTKKSDYSVYGKIFITDTDFIHVKDLIDEIEIIPEESVNQEDEIPENDPITFVGQHGKKILGIFYILCIILPIIIAIIAYS